MAVQRDGVEKSKEERERGGGEKREREREREIAVNPHPHQKDFVCRPIYGIITIFAFQRTILLSFYL